MTTSIPMPLSFELPDGWQPVAPTADNLFVAAHPGSANGFTATITITEQDRSDGATLPEIADESMHRLISVADNVSLRHRAEVGSPDAPGLTQIVGLSMADLELVQCQFLMSFIDTEDATHRIVVEAALTATAAQLGQLVADFERLVSTIRIA